MSDNSLGTPRRRSFMATMVAIAWSFVGLRRKKDFDDDVDGGMNPIYVVVGALIATAIFIAALLFFARQAVG